ncbi:LppA family lipoprotein [Nocardia sp. NPDC019395]|uniref:LppA family lipoprotein n=1 Tax=Nocardia sp. NPDC019395 TaxID=3154686 RepID=UPI0033D7E676
MPFYYSTTKIPNAVWPRFLERVREIAGTIGVTAPETMQDNGDRHDVWFSNPAVETTLKVSTNKNTVIAAQVGCHLPRALLSSPIVPTS